MLQVLALEFAHISTAGPLGHGCRAHIIVSPDIAIILCTCIYSFVCLFMPDTCIRICSRLCRRASWTQPPNSHHCQYHRYETRIGWCAGLILLFVSLFFSFSFFFLKKINQIAQIPKRQPALPFALGSAWENAGAGNIVRERVWKNETNNKLSLYSLLTSRPLSLSL